MDALTLQGNPAISYTYHHHIGTETAYGGCHTSGYHAHSGNSSSYGGCYTVGSHVHTGSASSGTGCYTSHVHTHTGNSSSVGGCYAYTTHAHTGSPSSGGGCYSVGKHSHSNSCYKEITCGWAAIADGTKSYDKCPDCAGTVYVDNGYWRCYNKRTVLNCSIPTGVYRLGCNDAPKNSGIALTCNNLPLNSWVHSSNYPTNHWSTNCYNSPINRWALGCGWQENEIMKAEIVFQPRN